MSSLHAFWIQQIIRAFRAALFISSSSHACHIPWCGSGTTVVFLEGSDSWFVPSCFHDWWWESEGQFEAGCGKRFCRELDFSGTRRWFVQRASSAAAMATILWYLQGCTIGCRCGSSTVTPGCSSFELSYVAFSGGELQKWSLRKRDAGKQLHLTRLTTRSKYSPLVESFGSTQHQFADDLDFLSELNDSGAWSASSDTTTPTPHREQSETVACQMEEEDKSSDLASQDSLPAANGDTAHGERLADIGHDIDMKKSARTRPPTMSLSQGFSSSARRSVSHTAAAVGHPVNTTTLPGQMGFAMVFAVAALGLKTAVEKQGFLPGTSQKVCGKCNGYGVQQCHVCQGRGVLTWEGKLRHTDPCPLCFGRCLKKCSSCGGVKIKKGTPPAMVTKLAGSNRK